MADLFYIPPENINVKEKTAILAGDEWLHAAKVMRLKTGDAIRFFDGTGRVYNGSISSGKSKTFTVQIKKIEERALNYRLAVFIGLSKGAKIDFITRALTEAGATSITGFFAQHSDIKKIAAGKDQRLRKIAIEACKQSERAFIPQIKMPVSFSEIVEMVSDFETRIVFYEKAQELLPPSTFKSKDITLIIGPKGGFSEEEIKQLGLKGILVSSLNDAVLKVETAAIAAVSIVRYAQLI